MEKIHLGCLKPNFDPSPAENEDLADDEGEKDGQQGMGLDSLLDQQVEDKNGRRGQHKDVIDRQRAPQFSENKTHGLEERTEDFA